MIIADLAGLVQNIQIAYKKEVMPPKPLEELEKYLYCPILHIKPGIYNNKPTIRVFIDNTLTPPQLRELKEAYLKREWKRGLKNLL